jgi:hypothetical protein
MNQQDLKNLEWTDERIKSYLVDHIKRSIQNDAGIAINAYWKDWDKTKEGKGFFAIPRLLFPEIDGLGSYITGNSGSTTENITQYFKTIMSKIDKRYDAFAAFIAVIYRHGLLHQHSPKNCVLDGENYGWQFAINSPNNPIEVQRKFHLAFHRNVLLLDMNVFFKDVVDSVDLAVEEIISNHRQEFIKSINEQNEPITERDRRLDATDIEEIKKIILEIN